MTRITVKCNTCGYQEQHTVKNQNLNGFQQNLSAKPCPKCNAAALGIADTEDLIDDFARIAEYTNTEVEIISIETEEGQMLRNAFGGIAAILRFQMHEQ
jgi:peptide chain release factor subunit 1